jgi:hypothetical protein
MIVVVVVMRLRPAGEGRGKFVFFYSSELNTAPEIDLFRLPK